MGLRLHGQGVIARDVRAVEIGLGSLNFLTVGGPYDTARASVAHAQFNAAYSFARALVDGRVDLTSYQDAALNDAAVIAITSKTHVIDDPAIDRASQAARVTLTLNDGRTIEAANITMKGSPQEPMSEDELMAKFHGCLEFGMAATPGAINRLGDAVMDIENAAVAATAIVEAFPGS